MGNTPDAPEPLCGADLEPLRLLLSKAQKRNVSQMDFTHELGMHRGRYTEMKKRGDAPLVKPRHEILMLLLEQYPQWSVSNEIRSMVTDAVDLMNRARPDRHYTVRDLAVLMGYEVSATLPWTRGRAMLPVAHRTLRLIIKGLRQPDPKDREIFFQSFEEIVARVGASHGMDAEQLTKSGFSGIRALRRERLGLPPKPRRARKPKQVDAEE